MATTTLVILDGWGLRDDPDFNAIAAARTPVWDDLLERFPHSRLVTSGMAVGLPDGQMGNSEVGHMNLGAGRTVYQSLTRINRAVADGSFHENRVLLNHMHATRQRNGALHVLGLLSDGGVHSHCKHIEAMCRMAAREGLDRVYVHAFLDGRDTAPRAARDSLDALQDTLHGIGTGRIVSLIGRYLAMDREQRWERTQQAWQLIVEGCGDWRFATASEGLDAAYSRDEDDEFVQPTVIAGHDEQPVCLRPEDGVVFMNFRPDRSRQLVQALTVPDFDRFDRSWALPAAQLVTLTRYSQDLTCPVAFAPESLRNGLGEYLAIKGRSQLRLAETEKYAHVTFFFNGGREEPFSGERRVLIPSPAVPSYDLQPEMSAYEVTSRLVKEIASGEHDLIVCNFANGDMVGHTGSFPAAIRAVEVLDECLGRVVAAVLENGGECLITADHGNVEHMLDMESGQRHTSHTTGPVPLVCVSHRADRFRLRDGGLSDVAPTLLELMQLPAPVEMQGRSLIEWKR
jgi:2,3-bisphosphoglycerate-independent phosphoglycerate mutase